MDRMCSLTKECLLLMDRMCSANRLEVKRIINEPTAAALAFGVIDSNTGFVVRV